MAKDEVDMRMIKEIYLINGISSLPSQTAFEDPVLIITD